MSVPERGSVGNAVAAQRSCRATQLPRNAVAAQRSCRATQLPQLPMSKAP
jgi:hypothetical protein